jgi:hypothetical protein
MLKPGILTGSRQKRLCYLGLLLASTLPAAAQMGASDTARDQQKATTVGADASQSDALTTLNNEFRSVYKQAKEHLAEETTPLIMCIGNHMVLIDQNDREQVDFIPPKYTQLKVVDHVPLALFILLDGRCDKPLSAETQQELDKIKILVAAVRPSLTTLGLDVPTQARQYQLLDLSIGFLERVLGQKQVSKQQLVSFCRELEPMIMKNVDQAVAAQLEIIDRTVGQWKEKIGAERFKKLTVIIVSGHMPREKHTCFQYFSKLLHVKREGLQIIYSEGPDEEKAARDLVGTHVLDASIGETFFKEKLRMHRDLLSDGAAHYLNAHPPLSQGHKNKHKND